MAIKKSNYRATSEGVPFPLGQYRTRAATREVPHDKPRRRKVRVSCRGIYLSVNGRGIVEFVHDSFVKPTVAIAAFGQTFGVALAMFEVRSPIFSIA